MLRKEKDVGTTIKRVGVCYKILEQCSAVLNLEQCSIRKRIEPLFKIVILSIH